MTMMTKGVTSQTIKLAISHAPKKYQVYQPIPSIKMMVLVVCIYTIDTIAYHLQMVSSYYPPPIAIIFDKSLSFKAFLTSFERSWLV